ncbi:MAG: hypothetical protein K6T63_00715 [Alicyclobacillus herbarius]|uniref:hypothetical protein n=1 Tax=Alicyclobacillus herbarius TaxID=122960 RepID=UPI002355CDA1|nr:hypothetical protein [Alicyclobacillus herbarius]MCL6631126.1 hypothetical protein [Alicyclobacillus herbarius]
MKRRSTNAALAAYFGALLIVICFYPDLDSVLDQHLFLHALWHIAIFTGAALLVYGLESLRTYARQSRRITSM